MYQYKGTYQEFPVGTILINDIQIPFSAMGIHKQCFYDLFIGNCTVVMLCDNLE